ncbi:hypothetical protein EPN42_04095 [bacterium]|nr:MAG: hypothetical protein EPN42_04095 [bacterium]
MIAALLLTAASALIAQLPGLFAPAAAARTVAVTPAASVDANVAAREAARAIDQTWNDLRPLSFEGDAAESDCRVKPFTADARIDAGDTPYADGLLVEVTFDLVDCAGWEVDQWTEQRLLPSGASRAEVERALRTLARRTATDADVWAHLHRQRAQRLFDEGLALLPGDPPTYLYSFYKTADGKMRVAARPGGPAWEAGARGGDVLVRLDGKFWWEYGTFQTQRRAYDGFPHTLSLERGGRTFDVHLGAPLTLR